MFCAGQCPPHGAHLQLRSGHARAASPGHARPWNPGRPCRGHHRGLVGCVLGVSGKVRRSGLILERGILVNISEEWNQGEVRVGRGRPSCVPAGVPGCSGCGPTRTGTDAWGVRGLRGPRGPGPTELSTCSTQRPACGPASSVWDHFSLFLSA